MCLSEHHYGGLNATLASPVELGKNWIEVIMPVSASKRVLDLKSLKFIAEERAINQISNFI